MARSGVTNRKEGWKFNGSTPPPDWPKNGFSKERLDRSLFEGVEVEGVYWCKGKLHPFRGRVTGVSHWNDRDPRRFHIYAESAENPRIYGYVWCEE